MSQKLWTFSCFFLVHVLPISCLPNPAPAATPGSDAFGNYSYSTIPASVLAAESAAYASYTKQFYATVAQTELAAISSYNAMQSSLYAAWTASGIQTLAASESAALASEYAAWTRSAAVYATYTGTGDPFASPTSTVPTTSAYVVPAAAAVAPTGTSWPALPEVKAPAAYGVQCQNVPAPSNAIFTVENCAVTIKYVCEHVQMSNDRYSRQSFQDRWVWDPHGGSGCAMGYWMPKAVFGTDKVPTMDECQQTIYGAMTSTCFPTYDSIFNTASVNLQVLPTRNHTGQQVDPGSMSYMIAPVPPDCDHEYPSACQYSIFQ